MAERVDTIVYGDNADRHRFEGRGPILSAALGGRETVVAETTTDKTLFTPGIDQSGKEFSALTDYDVAVVYHPSPRTQWTPNVRQLEYLESFVEGGGGLVALHSTLAILEEDPHHQRLADLIGGGIIEHGPPTTVRVEVERDHPITQGVDSFDLHDEPYDLDHREDVEVLARVEHESIGDSASLWTTSRGEGRICYCSNGHAPATFADANFQRLLANTVEWAAG